MNQVPEPKSVKNRVHIDVHTGDLDALVAAGASIVGDQDFRWTVMTDPDGQEFCAFVRETVPDELLYEVIIDCANPAAQAAWWGRVLGVEPQREADEDWSYLEPVPGAPFESLIFGPVPEPKTTKNRIHLDLSSPDVDALLAAGATMLRRSTDGPSEKERVWDVLADPRVTSSASSPRRRGSTTGGNPLTSLIHNITVDCADPLALSRFWTQVTGYAEDPDDPNLPGDTECRIAGAHGPCLLFIEVPNAKEVKNRVHLDLVPQDRTRDEEVERLLGLGAQLVDDRRRADGTGWAVLSDPEGNEFCVERSAAEREKTSGA